MAHVDRTKARTLTRIAQGGVLLLVGVAAAALLLLEFEPDPAPAPLPIADSQAPEPAPNQDNEPDIETINIEQLAEMFNQIGGIELADETPIVPLPPQDTTPDPEPITPTAEAVRYAGAMIAGDRSFALVIADNRQRVVRVGEPMPGVGEGATVTAIEPEAIEYETDGETTRLERHVAEGPMVGQILESTAGRSAIRTELQDAEQRRGVPRSPEQVERDRDREAFRAEVERRREAMRRERESREQDGGGDD